jgi:hypothetical protein
LEQRQKIQLFEDILYQNGYNGQFVETDGPRAEPPIDGSSPRVTVRGFVSNNHALYAEPDTFNLSLNEPTEAMPWVQLEVCNGEGRIHPFLLPLGKAGGIDDYSIVRATGRWIERDGAWHLILSKLVIFGLQGGLQTRRVARIGRRAACRYCGSEIVLEMRWGFDRTARIECGTCFDFRDSRAPRDFLTLCRKIAGNNRKHGNADASRSPINEVHRGPTRRLCRRPTWRP